MAGPFNRLYGQISDRWTSWLAVRRCIRLARADLAQFDELTYLAMPATNLPAKLSSAEVNGHSGGVPATDDALEAAIAELSLEQRLLLHLFKQGATYQEMATALGTSDKCVLSELKVVLVRLADRLLGPADRQLL